MCIRDRCSAMSVSLPTLLKIFHSDYSYLISVKVVHDYFISQFNSRLICNFKHLVPVYIIKPFSRKITLYMFPCSFLSVPCLICHNIRIASYFSVTKPIFIQFPFNFHFQFFYMLYV